MGIYVSDNAERELPPEGVHQAVCCDVIDLGMVETRFGKKYKIRMVWQLDDPSDPSKRITVIKQYGATLNQMSKLSKDLEGWRGKAFSAEERKRFDVEALIGKNCQLQIVHETMPDGKTWANIRTILPKPKGLPDMKVTAYERKKFQDASSPANRTPLESETRQAIESQDDVPF